MKLKPEDRRPEEHHRQITPSGIGRSLRSTTSGPPVNSLVKRQASQLLGRYGFVIAGGGTSSLTVVGKLTEKFPDKTALVDEYGDVENAPGLFDPPQLVWGIGQGPNQNRIDWRWNGIYLYFKKSTTFTPPSVETVCEIPLVLDLPGVGSNFRDYSGLRVQRTSGFNIKTPTERPCTLALSNTALWISLPNVTDDYEAITSAIRKVADEAPGRAALHLPDDYRSASNPIDIALHIAHLRYLRRVASMWHLARGYIIIREWSREKKDD
ncbi:hypothetical protein VTJ83DRAFT_2468 [Remersonia thermophila]|uniref:Uncharacterized protein n=1 Tax=Remersonia thermophila TaxID=72144 RepID=A0ABR4DLV9_9PEZI